MPGVRRPTREVEPNARSPGRRFDRVQSQALARPYCPGSSRTQSALHRFHLALRCPGHWRSRSRFGWWPSYQRLCYQFRRGFGLPRQTGRSRFRRLRPRPCARKQSGASRDRRRSAHHRLRDFGSTRDRNAIDRRGHNGRLATGLMPNPGMNYEIEFKPRALKDLKALPPTESSRIVAKAEALQNNLAGDVKRLTKFTPEYRLRVGNYRVLFEGEESKVVIY